MRCRAVGLGHLVIALAMLAGGSASAEIYKYKAKDGSTVYTQDIGQLPRERQVYYRKRAEEREARTAALEAKLGSAAAKEREEEARRKAILAAQMDEAERQRRLQAIDQTLHELRSKRQAQRADEAVWRERIQTARASLEENLKAFREAQGEYQAIAIQPSFTLLPGQRERMDELEKRVSELELKVDALVVEVEETIPEEARKAGIPPGWLR